jgi:hypothetical protein
MASPILTMPAVVPTSDGSPSTDTAPVRRTSSSRICVRIRLQALWRASGPRVGWLMLSAVT